MSYLVAVPPVLLIGIALGLNAWRVYGRSKVLDAAIKILSGRDVLDD